VIAFVFPGQGAQRIGMGRALADTYPEARSAFEQADRAFGRTASGRTLSELVFDGPEDELTLTEYAQPAILTVSVAAYRALEARGVSPALVAGHSLGEYSAHVAAGTIDFGDAVATVRRRGRYMQEAVPVGVGAMAAILGADADTVRRACEEAAEGEVVSAANLNGGGQVVIAGHAGAVSRACERAKALGARRAMPLAVSAPFHCALMRPAEDRLDPELRALHAAQPRIPVVANVDGTTKRDAAAAIEALVRQVSAPVLWDAVVERLACEGVTTFVEVGPGKALTGMIKRIRPDARLASFEGPDDLASVEETCSH
jgi:[acyl-carrier-protein] S-malonyltransferase